MDKTFVIVMIVSFVVLSAPAFADIIQPTETTIYFERNGQPWNQPVDYTVKCYGYSWTPGPPVEKEPGTYTPEEVFTYSASCPGYGCKIYENYYTNYRHMDYCDLEGTTLGQSFKISNYADRPVSGCTHISEVARLDDGKYYKRLDGWEDCMEANDYEYERCSQYIVEVPISEIPMDDKGHPIEVTCTSRFQMPDSVTGDAGPAPKPPTTSQQAGDSTMLIVAGVILVIALVGLLLMKMGKCPMYKKK